MSRNTTRRRQLRTALGSLVVALTVSGSMSMTVGARSANAQPPQRPMSQTLVRRIAEIIDGHRSGDTIYIVASYNFPHGFYGSFRDPNEARDLARRDLALALGVFGPYITLGEPPIFFVGCRHDGFGSAYHATKPICPPEDMRRFRSHPDSMSVTVHFSGARPETIRITPGTDALFFTLPAMDKFYFPYYAKVLGADSVAGMRRRFVEGITAP